MKKQPRQKDETLREEQTRLIGEIAARTERLRYVTILIEDRWRDGTYTPDVPEVAVRRKPPQDAIDSDGRRLVTQK